jgi:putative ABC transport system permease protein
MALALVAGAVPAALAARAEPMAVVGTLLGNVVTVQVRGVDYVAVAATVILGVLAVADALLISIAERAPELATLRAFGWPEAALRRMVISGCSGGGRRPGDLPGRTASRAPAPPAARRAATRPGVSHERR